MDKIDWEYYVIAGAFLISTAVTKTLDKMYKKEVITTLGIATSLMFSIIGGVIAGFLASVYIETVQLQWVSIAAGSWMGERLLDSIADALDEKIDLIFNKHKENEK